MSCPVLGCPFDGLGSCKTRGKNGGHRKKGGRAWLVGAVGGLGVTVFGSNPHRNIVSTLGPSEKPIVEPLGGPGRSPSARAQTDKQDATPQTQLSCRVHRIQLVLLLHLTGAATLINKRDK